MSIKNLLLRLKELYRNTPERNVDQFYSSDNSELVKIIPVDLNDKVDEFIKWYYENMVKGHYTTIGEYRYPIEMRDFIEKMAVWYELRYPDYEVYRLIHGLSPEIDINKVMFKRNPYINDLVDENSDARELEWNDFYNIDVFIESLPWEERWVLSEPWYSSISYLFPTKEAPFNLHLTRDGIVEKSEYVSIWTNSVVTDEELVGLHVRQVIELFKSRNIELPINSIIAEVILDADKQMYCKEEMLNCVMYRIIERGGNRMGARRAFLFAKEFNRNIDIPMKYSVDFSDPCLRLFMNEYLRNGGSKDLKCYEGYFLRDNKNEKINTISIQDLILTQHNNAATFYTPEEDELHQKIVDILESQINQDELKKEEVKQLRLKRKLEKSHLRQ